MPALPNWPPPRDGQAVVVEPGARPHTRGWALTVVIVVALIGGAGLSIAGWMSRSGDDSVVLDVENEASAIPSTVAPVATPVVTEPRIPGSNSSDSPRPAPSPVAEPADPPVSPLSELLGEQYSAVPAEVAPRPRPVGLEIDAFDVTAYPVRPVGLEPDGQLEIPDETEIGWYQYGATAGRPGATVLAAHVSWNRTVGPFGQLGSLEPGNSIAVTLDDGTTRRYEVYERALYGKLELPRERIWRNTGPETLVLITCGGDFNPEVRRYRQNIVIYAAPVG